MQLQLRYITDTEKDEMIEKLSNTITVKKLVSLIVQANITEFI